MSANENAFSVMDQHADATAHSEFDVVRSGLAHVGLAEKPGKPDGPSSVLFTELPVTGLLLLRATTEATALGKALEKRCGVPLSGRLRSETKDRYCVRWMSPDCWLLSCPLEEAFDIEQSLRVDVSGHIAIVNVSGGYSVIELSGLDARSILMKSTGYDVHPDHFGEGKVVNTTFAKAQVTMRAVKLGESVSRYELIVRRSFSDYVWLWLQRAGAEYGMAAVAAGDQAGQV